MKSKFLDGHWAVLFLITAFALGITPGIPAQACEPPPPPPPSNDGPVYLILSLEEEFATPTLGGGSEYPSLTASSTQQQGSETVILKIGTYVAGAEIGFTRFDLADNGGIELPDGTTLDELNGYEITILGAFDTTSPDTVHLVTPDEAGAEGDPIPRKVQEAFFLASPDLELLTQGEEETLFPTTVEIAQFIYDFATDPDTGDPDYFLGDQSGEGGEGPLTVQQILDNIFVTDAELVAGGDPEEDVYAEADGDLYPHQPEDGKPLFGFAFDIDNDELTIDVALTVDIDVKPGNAQNVVNYKSKGVVWVAILTTVVLDADDDEVVVFDATEDVDEETVVLGPDGAMPQNSKEQDANKDGYDDLFLKFKVADIGLTKDTTEVTLRGLDVDDRSFAGTDLVTTVPPKGKKK